MATQGSQYLGFQTNSNFRNQVRTDVVRRREKLRVFALWKRSPDEAEQLAEKALSTSDDVVVVRSVDSEVLPVDFVRKLEDRGIKVFSVPATYVGVSERSSELLSDVATYLVERVQMLARQASRKKPSVVQDAAAELASVSAAFPSSSPKKREEFLNDFYGSDSFDDGVR